MHIVINKKSKEKTAQFFMWNDEWLGRRYPHPHPDHIKGMQAIPPTKRKRKEGKTVEEPGAKPSSTTILHLSHPVFLISLHACYSILIIYRKCACHVFFLFACNKCNVFFLKM